MGRHDHGGAVFIRRADGGLHHELRARLVDVRRRLVEQQDARAQREAGGERHALALGAGYDQMMARGLFFALARIHVSTLRAPRQGETVVHTTWPGEMNRFFCPRYHVFSLEDGTPLAAAGALWVMLDTKQRRIVSPQKVDLGFLDNSDLPAPVALPTRLPALRGETPQVFNRTPQYSDFDVNGHVNNTKYIAWLCDALGFDALRGAYIGDLVAGYEKEIRGHDALRLTLARQDNAFSFQIASAANEKHFVAGGTLRPEG